MLIRRFLFFSFYSQRDGIAPTFEKKPAIRQAEDGRVLFFECLIVADPEPAVTWYHNGETVALRGRFSSTLDGTKANTYKSVMKIVDVNIEDAGKYKVVAKNELGESNAAISLNFDGKIVGCSYGECSH